MNEELNERFVIAIERLACGVDKIGDGINSIATYLWLPFYIIVFLISLLAIGYLMFSLV